MQNESEKRRSILRLTLALVLTAVVSSECHAELIKLDSTTLSGQGVSTLLKAQQLEDELNSKIFNPRGMELELAAPTGGTLAVDDFAFEGPGLTVIGGSGFILRWLTTPVDSVRIGFSSAKDDGVRTVYAFDSLVDYTRDPAQTSQSSNGNVTAVPDFSAAVNAATGVVPAQGDLSLTVNAPSISSVWVDTNFFLTSWFEVEFETVSGPVIPEPSTMILFGIGLTGLGIHVARRRVRQTI